jgi:CAAX prenyl protease-like protein
LVWPGFRRFSWRPSLLPILVGTAGVIVWVALCELAWDQKLLRLAGLSGVLNLGERPALNPFTHFSGRPGALGCFLAIRFFGLVVVVPVIEEFFLRGFLMRVVMAADWWKVPFGRVDAMAVAASLIVPALTHPAELAAAVVWFGMVTWMMVKTRNLWDCVVAHAVTNLLLGVYVLASGAWTLW